MKKKVFIANVRENDDFATKLHEYLTEHGIDCFHYQINLLPGDHIEQKTKNEIEESDHCIICFSKELNVREKTDMRREIYTAIGETLQRKPNSAFIIPIKVNHCQIEDYKITSMTNMQDLWYADFSKDVDKAYRDLLKRLSDSGQENSTDITVNSKHSYLISLRRDNNPSLKFEGYFIGESTDQIGWNYKIYKTADTVKECDYIIYVDRRDTIVMVGQLYDVIQYDSLESLKADLSQRIEDERCRTDLLEILGIDDSEYLE